MGKKGKGQTVMRLKLVERDFDDPQYLVEGASRYVLVPEGTDDHLPELLRDSVHKKSRAQRRFEKLQREMEDELRNGEFDPAFHSMADMTDEFVTLPAPGVDDIKKQAEDLFGEEVAKEVLVQQLTSSKAVHNQQVADLDEDPDRLDEELKEYLYNEDVEILTDDELDDDFIQALIAGELGTDDEEEDDMWVSKGPSKLDALCFDVPDELLLEAIENDGKLDLNSGILAQQIQNALNDFDIDDDEMPMNILDINDLADAGMFEEIIQNKDKILFGSGAKKDADVYEVHDYVAHESEDEEEIDRKLDAMQQPRVIAMDLETVQTMRSGVYNAPVKIAAPVIKLSKKTGMTLDFIEKTKRPTLVVDESDDEDEELFTVSEAELMIRAESEGLKSLSKPEKKRHKNLVKRQRAHRRQQKSKMRQMVKERTQQQKRSSAHRMPSQKNLS
ncbi:hypothetical protein PCE1_001086 [Barthelona sp. PCE]